MPAEAATAELQSRRFLWLYALASAGGAIAYVPFLTILLPMRVTGMAGTGNDVTWLAYATFAGAIAASLSNIAFGWASDATRRREPWIAAGLLSSCLLLGAFGAASGVRETIILIVAWQVALNMMLAPLAAWAGDHVPDVQKGRLGGLLAFAPAAGALAGVLVTLPNLASADTRLWLVAVLVLGCVAPVLLFGRPRTVTILSPEDSPQVDARARGRVARMWLARLMVQVAEAALFAFLFFWFRSIDPVMTDARVAQIFGVILLAAVPLALAAGRWVDRHDEPFSPLAVCAAAAAVGLLVMAAAPGLGPALVGYIIFGLAVSVFLSLHSAQTLRVLPRAWHRGRDLGYFNLTNTVPSLVMPWLTLALVPAFGFTGLFVALAAFALTAMVLLLGMALPR